MGSLEEASLVEVQSPFDENEYVGIISALVENVQPRDNGEQARRNQRVAVSRPTLRANRSSAQGPDGSVEYTPPHPSEIIPVTRAARRPPPNQRVNTTDFRRSTRRSLNTSLASNSESTSNMTQHSPARRGRTLENIPTAPSVTHNSSPMTNYPQPPIVPPLSLAAHQTNSQLNTNWSLSTQPRFPPSFAPFANGVQTPMGWMNPNPMANSNILVSIPGAPSASLPAPSAPLPAPSHPQANFRAYAPPPRAHSGSSLLDSNIPSNSVRQKTTRLPAPRQQQNRSQTANMWDIRPQAAPVNSAFDDFLQQIQSSGLDVNYEDILAQLTSNPSFNSNGISQPSTILPRLSHPAMDPSQFANNFQSALTEILKSQQDGTNLNLNFDQPIIPSKKVPPPPLQPKLPPTEDDMAEQDREADASQDEVFHEAETYSDYIPAKLTIGCKHPDPVVETSSLSSVEPPDITYKLKLPARVIDNGLLSALQLESVIYASQQHNLLLPDGTRKGFLIGDGAGVGKGRTIAGIIYENYLCGRKKSIWLSVSTDLKFDAERDLKDIGAKIPVFFLSKFPYGRRINEDHGVIFTTYAGLISKSQTVRGNLGSRIGQLTTWLGPNFEGIIVFDECHKAKNISTSSKTKVQSKAAEYAVEIQNKLPKARIVYASATGASETRHLGYMTRLGIWGKGTPYKTFADFCTSVEKRGVGGMEMVAVELKMRGSYIARQLSFKTTTFQVRIAHLDNEFVKLYDDCVDLWAKAFDYFTKASNMIRDKKSNRTIWTSFWAAHQKFFKYLCIGAKVPLVVDIAKEALDNDKCVVIGLQSTGEAKTMEALDDGDINEFVSTARATFESLIENHFPGPQADRRSRAGTSRSVSDRTDSSSSGACAVSNSESSGSTVDESWHGHDVVKFMVQNGKVKAQLEEERIKNKGTKNSNCSNRLIPKARGTKKVEQTESSRALRAKLRACKRKGRSRIRYLKDESEDTDISDPSSESLPTTSTASSHKTKSTDSDSTYVESETDDDEEEIGTDSDSNTLIDGSSTENEDVIVKQQASDSDDSDVIITAVKPGSKKAPEIVFLSSDDDDDNDDDDLKKEGFSKEQTAHLITMRDELYSSLDRLAPRLPHNTLDDLIDRLGGTSKVAEMTGRKGRIVKDSYGKISYKCRNENDALDNLNIAEKERFMSGKKLIAIISEAASSGISLQADRRVENTKRRVHITIELPWSADRAIQQFGRTHRSNQLSGPEYVFVISELAGEKRFASIVAKRLESLGALTHGDRRATTETRDLSQFNIASRYCKQALELLFRYIDSGTVFAHIKPDYPESRFIEDAHEAFVGAGIGIKTANYFAVEPVAHNINTFLNRLLGMKVGIQNALFKLFTDYMDRLILRKKVVGQYDAGILELNSDSGKTRCSEPEIFKLKTQSGYVTCALRNVQVERGVSWEEALKLLEDGNQDSRSGFYISTNPLTKAQMVFMILRESIGVDLFRCYKPNTGKAPKSENLTFLIEKAQKSSKAAAEKIWRRVYEITHVQCVHMCFFRSCKRIEAKMRCDVGMRHRNYCILSGGILTALPLFERYTCEITRRLQIVRLKLDATNKVIGPIIPQDMVDAFRKLLKDAEKGVNF